MIKDKQYIYLGNLEWVNGWSNYKCVFSDNTSQEFEVGEKEKKLIESQAQGYEMPNIADIFYDVKNQILVYTSSDLVLFRMEILPLGNKTSIYALFEKYAKRKNILAKEDSSFCLVNLEKGIFEIGSLLLKKETTLNDILESRQYEVLGFPGYAVMAHLVNSHINFTKKFDVTIVFNKNGKTVDYIVLKPILKEYEGAQLTREEKEKIAYDLCVATLEETFKGKIKKKERNICLYNFGNGVVCTWNSMNPLFTGGCILISFYPMCRKTPCFSCGECQNAEI